MPRSADLPASAGLDRELYAELVREPPPPAIDPKHQKDIDHDVALGKSYAKQIAEDHEHYKLSTNKEDIDRVDRIGKQLAAIADVTHAKVLWGDSRLSPFEYHFTVLADTDVNAFSLPGGFIYVDEGLINFVESDDELAGVLAHEISHAAFRHVATLQHEASKLQWLTIPAILVAIFSVRNAPASLEVSQLFSQAIGSGWSINAEKAADYGGFQFMQKSPYNPVAMLTMMERLAQLEKTQPEGFLDLGILRTHPPGPERAEALTKYLTDAGIAIHRSEVTTSYRTTVKAGPQGAFEIDFGKRKIATLRGENASARATDAAKELNEFFDEVPALYEVRAGPDGSIIGKGQILLKILPSDVEAGSSPTQAAVDAVKSMKDSLYMLAYRVWDSH